MKALIVILTLLASLNAMSQTKEYVCTPCGNACDKVAYTKPGMCSTCHMKLVEKVAIKFINLRANEFCQRISANPNSVLLDVRTKGEFEGKSFGNTYGHFKNAININVEDLEARMAELVKYKNREVLVYCSHSVRSPRAAMMLTEKGFQNVKNMEGGVSILKLKGDDCLTRNFIAHQ